MMKLVLLIVAMSYVETTNDPTHLCQELLAVDCLVSYIQGHKDETVCGTDDVTYMNFCYYSQARCKSSTLFLKNKGACSIVSTHPPTAKTSTEPTHLCQVLTAMDCSVSNILGGKDQTLCGTDNVTYINSCYFGKATCRDNTLLTKHLGACGILSTPPTTAVPSTIMDPLLQAFCQSKNVIVCPIDNSPICASNKQAYLNKCVYSKAVCDDPTLVIKSLDFCIGVVVGK